MKILRLMTPAVLVTILGACGGSSGSGDDNQPPIGPGPTDLTAAGKITGFGSIYVNGVEFETDTASYEVDDQTGSGDSSLSVGMFVKVKGTVNADGISGTADSVYYDDEIEGPVANLVTDPADTSVKMFTIFDVAIVIGSDTVFESEDGSAFGFDTILNGDNVEASGVYHGDTLHASYLELQEASDDDYEVKGTITELIAADQFTLTLGNGSTLNVLLAAGAEIPSGGISVDLYVEVEGTIPDPAGAPNDMLATKVEVEDSDYFDESDDEVEIKGPLSLNLEDGSWTINGTLIVFSGSTTYDPSELEDAIADGSADGRIVEVEGNYVDGALHADEVEDEEDDIEIKAVVDFVDPIDAKNGTITVAFPGTTGGKDGMGRLDVIVTGATFYLDDDATSQFDLATLPLGTVVEFDARYDDAGNIVASTLEIEDSMESELEGIVDAIDDTMITILTIVFAIDVNTAFPNGAPVAGNYASVEDINADGTADSVEIDD